MSSRMGKKNNKANIRRDKFVGRGVDLLSGGARFGVSRDKPLEIKKVVIKERKSGVKE